MTSVPRSVSCFSINKYIIRTPASFGLRVEFSLSEPTGQSADQGLIERAAAASTGGIRATALTRTDDVSTAEIEEVIWLDVLNRSGGA